MSASSLCGVWCCGSGFLFFFFGGENCGVGLWIEF